MMSESQLRVKGYKNRPWWVTSTALFFLLLPILSLGLKLYEYEPVMLFNVKRWMLIFNQFKLINWLLISLSLSLGLMIFWVRKTTLVIVSFIILSIVLINLFVVKKLFIFALIFPFIFWLSPFKRPYLDRATRWWENLPRFWIKEQEAKVTVNGQLALIMNISLSGILVKMANSEISYRLEEEVELEFSDFKLKAKFKRHENSDQGFQFKKLSHLDKRKLKLFIKTHQKSRSR